MIFNPLDVMPFRIRMAETIEKDLRRPMWETHFVSGPVATSAEDMRKLTDMNKAKEHAAEFRDVIAKIQKAAIAGKDHIAIAGGLSDYNRKKLEELGYVVFVPVTSEMEELDTIEISW